MGFRTSKSLVRKNRSGSEMAGAVEVKQQVPVAAVSEAVADGDTAATPVADDVTTEDGGSRATEGRRWSRRRG